MSPASLPRALEAAWAQVRGFDGFSYRRALTDTNRTPDLLTRIGHGRGMALGTKHK